MFRVLALIAGLVTLVACTNANDLAGPAADLGDFQLGHRVVVSPNLTKGPLSREADAEEWEKAMLDALGERFDRYEGEKLYHFGISVEGYVLAQPGIPVVANPKSILIFNLTIWDDAAGKKLNEEVEQITVFESMSGETLLSSGLTQTKEQQLQNLSRNAAKQIQSYMIRMKREKGWFGGAGDSVEAPETADAGDEVTESEG
ncbi:hypothetical protein M8756_11225 [Lutimaribacter sp. EGI FJ00015]|uniref:Uncharacterized protein n=1 Tax=Lutimaribacter degradans TaxID=2945989 RepID=A0ACC5ZWN1_9RHOB|nr:hypothetical protein [Lutimaribacter sp. EGI FJ00013]MCM2562721.1 hypothetical protein [Lutimaribacter sp. EGI FJ00013]MCO0613878.1 hypothetical protein [Lutimaribacter sp. EGI FJ00015]MCO0636639.1 hypothetical protein [Lutimaribacter sp. EGI FJ00014]